MTDEVAEIEARGEYTPDDLRKMAAKWLDRIAASESREKRWTKDAEAAEAAYLCDTESRHELPEFNILHSNVETIVPSIYNSTPVPDIRARHNSPDPVAKQASDVLERVIAAQIDDNRLDQEIEAAANDAFMAGRGVVRIKFDADEQADPMGQVVPVNERVIYEAVSWRDYREGPAKRWADVPWVAYRHNIPAEVVEKLSDEVLRDMQRDPNAEAHAGDADITLWEIWCKDSNKVYLIAVDGAKVLKITEDPMGLSGFFPQGQPIVPISVAGKRVPVCPYSVYKTLAEELDITTRRINALVKGLKVRGAIAGDAEAIELIAALDDNQLAPVPNLEGLIAMGGLDKAVMWWPIETAVAVIRELYVQREQTKQAIYEITGISDIIRGQGNAGETATAQQIKTQWGALRVKKMQRMIERQVRDLFVLTAELISAHFSPQTMQKASGIQITEEVLQVLASPLDHYRIDVESDSTVRADLTRNRQEMAEFLNGTAQFFAAMAPLVQQSPSAAEPIAEVYSSFSRQFNLGKQAEDAMARLVEMAKEASKNPPPNPEQEAAKADMEMKRQDMQSRMAMEQHKMQLEVERAQLDVQITQAELQIKRAELGLAEQKLKLDEGKAFVEASATMAALQMQDESQEGVE